MALVERFRLWYEHERDANQKMLAMLESVPVAKRRDAMFQRAVDYTAHLAACRENWLDRMIAGGNAQVDWFPSNVDLASLPSRFDETEARWVAYLESLSESELDSDFDFPIGDGRQFRWNVEGQIVQLLGHAFYHRGMIAMIVDDLGGDKQDTDYLFWMYERDPRWGEVK